MSKWITTDEDLQIDVRSMNDGPGCAQPRNVRSSCVEQRDGPRRGLANVILADRLPLVRAGLSSILEHDGSLRVVAEAGTLDVVVAQGVATAPDVVVMDIDLPGLDLRRDIVRVQAPVVLLGDVADQGRAWAALDFGVRGFVPREHAFNTICLAVRAVAFGQASFPPSMVGWLLDTALTNGSMDLDSVTVLDSLTRREREVLDLMVDGLSNGQIALRLVVGHCTVKSHVNSILRKLGVSDRTQAVIVAFRVGQQQATARLAMSER